jgi:hypothetical protein
VEEGAMKPAPHQKWVPGQTLYSDRDWPEDFAGENGNYECICCACKKHFVGNKHRVTCKTCDALEKSSRFNASEELQKVAHEATKKYWAEKLKETSTHQEDWYQTLKDLLAIIHRDGGHHSAKVGIMQSIEDAKTWIYSKFREEDNMPDGYVDTMLRTALGKKPPNEAEIIRYQESYIIFKDGDMWCAVPPGFIDLQTTSLAGFGTTPKKAMKKLWKEAKKYKGDGGW